VGTAPTTIPTSIEEVTPEWLRAATGLAVEGHEVEQIGQGIGVSSAVFRLHLAGEGCPTTAVVKLPALDEAAIFTSTVLRMYLREVAFFTLLAGRSPIRVPEVHHAAADEETSAFVVVMEDMGDARSIDQIVGMDLADAEQAVDELAAWHAAFWGQGDALAAAGTTVSLGDPLYPAIIPMVFAEGWEKVERELDVPAPVAAVGPRFVDAHAGLMASLAEGPTTMIHGDYRADNLLFDAAGRVVALDFQLIGSGRGAYDLAYLLTQSLRPDEAAQHERALFERWVAGLVEHGVPAADADLDECWMDYRRAALFCLVYPVVACRGMDLDDPRQHDLTMVMLERSARAMDQLSLPDLL
jgi:aminoglycoside phosphotransferase (APT) family kinase protein